MGVVPIRRVQIKVVKQKLSSRQAKGVTEEAIATNMKANETFFKDIRSQAPDGEKAQLLGNKGVKG